MSARNRPETTKMLSDLTIQLIDPHGDQRIYWAREVTFDYRTNHKVRVDFMDNVQLDGKVIGEFTCEKIQNIFHIGYTGQRDSFYCTADQNHNIDLWQEELLKKSAMNLGELDQYLHGKGFAWYISGLKVYDKPMDITEFTRLKDFHGIMDVNPVEKPPQSWRYVLELKEGPF